MDSGLFLNKNFKVITLFKNRELTGIGKYSAYYMLKLQGFTVYQKNIVQFNKISNTGNLNKFISKLYIPKLKNIIKKNIIKFIKLKCYKGERHSLGLPVRGQRSKTNAKTRKHRKII